MAFVMGKNNRKKKRIIALIMCLLMMTTLITSGRFTPRANGSLNFLDYVTKMQLSTGDSESDVVTSDNPVNMKENFKIELNFQLPNDTDDWHLADNLTYSFSLDKFYADNVATEAQKDVENFIKANNTSEAMPIFKGEVQVGTYTITNGVVNLDFAMGVANGELTQGNRMGYFRFDCGLDEDKFDDHGGTYTLKFETSGNPETPTVTFNQKDHVYKNIDITKTESSYDASTGTITYNVAIVNNNDTAVTNLVINDTINNKLSYVGEVTTNPSVQVTDVATSNGAEFTIAGVPANTTVNMTYKCKLTDEAYIYSNNASGNQWNQATNTITAKLDDLDIYLNQEHSTSSSVGHTVKKDVTQKTGALIGNTNEIEWTITLNAGEDVFDLAGYTFKDEMDSRLTLVADSIIVTGGTTEDRAGIKAAITNGNGYTFPTGSTGQYTITYKTTYTPEAGTTEYKNKATVGKNGVEDSSQASVPVGSKISKKEYAGNTTVTPIIEDGNALNATYGGQLELKWKTTVDVPASVTTLKYVDYVTMYDQTVSLIKDSFVISIDGGATLVAGTDYTVGVDDFTNGGGYNGEQNIAITFTNEGITKIKGKKILITYTTIGDYKDRTENDYKDRYSNNYRLYFDSSKEEGSASVEYKYTKPKTSDVIEKSVDGFNKDTGVVNWAIHVECPTGNVTNVKITDSCTPADSMTYYGYDKYVSYVYDGTTNTDVVALIRLDPAGTPYEVKMITDASGNYVIDLKKENIRYYYNSSGFGNDDLTGLLDENGKLLSDIYIYYQTKVSGDYAKYNNTTTYENTATIDYNLDSTLKTGFAKADQEIEYKVLTKKAENSTAQDGASGITYSIDVNKFGEDLSLSYDYYCVQDTLPNDLVLRLDSIELTSNGSPLTPADSEEQAINDKYYITYSGNTINFYVPDGKPITIKYTVSMLNGVGYGSKTFYNTAKLIAPYVSNESFEESNVLRSISSSAANMSADSFIIKKVDSTDLTNNLKDAKFEVKEYTYNEATSSWDLVETYTGLTNPSGELSDVELEDAAGNRLVVTKNNLYEIREIEAPSGYEKTSKYYKVVIPDTNNPIDASKIPSDAYPIVSGTKLTFTDVPKTEDNKLVITKTYYKADGINVSDEYPTLGATIQIFNQNLTIAQCESGSYTPLSKTTGDASGFKYEEAYSQVAKTHTITLSKIPNGTYTVYEKSAASGYEKLDRVYHFTVSDDKISWEGQTASMSETAGLANRESIKNEFVINKYYFSPNADTTNLNIAKNPAQLSADALAVFTCQKTHEWDEGSSSYAPVTEAPVTITRTSDEARYSVYTVKNLQPGKYVINETAGSMYQANDVYPITVTVDATGKLTAVDKNGGTVTNLNAEADADIRFVSNAINVFKENSVVINKTYYEANGTQTDSPADADDKAVFTLYKGNTVAVAGTDYGTYTAPTAGAASSDVYTWSNLEPGTYKLVETTMTGYEPVADVTVVVDDNYQISVNSKPATYAGTTDVSNRKIDNTPCRFYINKKVANQSGVLSDANSAKITFRITGGSVDADMTYNASKSRWEAEGLTEGTYTIKETLTYDGYVKAKDITVVIQNDTNGHPYVTQVTYGDGSASNDFSISSVTENSVETVVANLINRPEENKITVAKHYVEPGNNTLTNATPSDKAEFTLYSVDAGSNETLITTSAGDSNNLYTFEKLEQGNYVIKETKTPDGYTAVSDVKFTVAADYKITITSSDTGTVIARNTGVTDYVKAVDAYNVAGNEFKFAKYYYDNNNNMVTDSGVLASLRTGTVFTLVYPDNSQVTISGTNGVYTVSNLKDGTYTIKETQTPSGYATAADITLVVSDSRITATYAGSSLEFKNILNNGKFEVSADLINNQQTNRITISKSYTNPDGTVVIPYNTISQFASFELYDATGTNKITSGYTYSFDIYTGTYEFKNIAAGSYTVKETAPTGFVKADDLKFTVDSSGVISVTPADGWTIENQASGSTTNNTRDVKLSAVNRQTANELKLRKTYLDDYNVNDESQYANTSFKLQGTTKTYNLTYDTTNKVFGIKNIDAGTYELVEEVSPAGYKKVDGTITITVRTDRTISVSYNGSSSDFTVYANNAAAAEIGLINRKVSNSLKINKIYVTADGSPINIATDMTASEYASFDLYKRDSNNALVKITDANKLVANKTTGNYEFVNLDPGSYVIREVAGTGFNKIGDITFTVDSNMNILSVSGTYTGMSGDSLNKSLTVKNTRKVFDNSIAIDKEFHYPNDVVNTGDYDTLIGQVEFTIYKSGSNTGSTLTYNAQTKKFEYGNLEPGNYVIKETASPAGYTPLGDMAVTVTKTGAAATKITLAYLGNNQSDVSVTGTAPKPVVKAVNRMILDNSFTISKKYFNENGFVTDAADLRALYADTAFKLVNTTDSSLYYDLQFNAATGTYGIENIMPGSYRVVETPPSGYSASGSILLSVSNLGKINASYNGAAYDFTASRNDTYDAACELINRSNRISLQIGKYDGKGALLSGAELAIINENGAELYTWTSDGTIRSFLIADFYPDEIYTLKEKKSPYGYALAEPVEFKVDSQGNVYVMKDGQFVANAEKTINMIDEALSLKISKTDKSNGKVLPGATITISDKNNRVVEKWTTTGAAREIPLLTFTPEEEYVLTEVTAPFGYEYIQNITFKVKEDGTILVKQKDGSFKLMNSDTFVLEDDPSYVCISKVDLTTGDKLVGAKLTIADAATGKEVIDTWISTDDVHKILMNKFKPGVWYTLEENQAPLGYDIAETITFMINEKGDIYLMVDGKPVLATDSLIIMKDSRSDTSSSLKTGDDTPIKPMAIMLIISMVCMLIMYVGRKKLYR